MAWQTEFAADAERDFELIFDHLLAAYESFGDPRDHAVERAGERLIRIREAAEGICSNLGDIILIGSETISIMSPRLLHDDIAPGLRHATIDRAIFWFDLNESAKRVRILSVFFGGQDHVRHMLRRLLDRE